MQTLDFLWYCEEPPDIIESVFSYDYCKNTSRKLCEAGLKVESWHEVYLKSEIYNSILQRDSFVADSLMVVSNPEVVISPAAVKQMIKSLEQGASAVVPCFNESSNIAQTANLPCIYLNLSTYLEAAELMNVGHNSNIVSDNSNIVNCNIDLSCILIHKECVGSFLSFIEKETSIKKALSNFLNSIISNNTICVINKSALIHSFGNYYGGKRDDLVDLIPDSAKSILDIGCANGGFGEIIKSKLYNLRQAHQEYHNAGINITGVEMNPVMAERASAYYDKIYNAKIEDIEFKTKFDHINCGDVIEHLYEPWQMLKIFNGLLKREGSIVISLPNAGHWTIVKDLAEGKFEYIPVGLLCLTHIRWFTEKSIKEALYEAGFEIELFLEEKIPPTPNGEKFIKLLCDNNMGDKNSLLTNQFTIRAWKK